MARDDALLELGKEIRSRRWRRGWDQRTLAAAAGTSASVVGRMELGDGGGVRLQTWLAVADVLGLPPMWSTSEIPYATVLPRLAEGGGWRPTGVAKNMLLLDRAAHPVPTLRHVQRPNERAVLRVVSTLTDRDHERRELGDAIERERERAPDDRRISGALVVVRHGSNTRIAGRAHGRSDGLWIRALRDPAAAMPVRMGWVWLAPRGTHLLPGA